MNRDAIARALGALAQHVETGDVVAVMPGSHAVTVIKRGLFGTLPCDIVNGALLLKCVKRAVSARPPIVTLHFRSVTLRYRPDDSCFADLDGKDVRAYAVMVPGRVQVFVYGLN